MEEKKNDQLQAVWLAAGALAVVAASSLDRASVVYSILKQWRSWVFLVLNVLLFAIVFTSKHGGFSDSKAESDVDKLDDDCYMEECNVDSEIERKKRVRKQEEEQEQEQQWRAKISEDEDHLCKVMKSCEKKDVEEKEKIIECDDRGKLPVMMPLSNEELNERVEAFIATFRRQYLVSDVKGRSSSSVSTSPVKNGGGILMKSISV